MPANHPDPVRLSGLRGVMAFPRLRNPIVLVHGLMGFDAIRIGRIRFRGYFPGIEESMRAAGNRVHCASLSPTASIAHRAGQLRAFVDNASPTEPVHVIAHSMGGLDARYMVSRLDMADRVLSLTTIATPHRGSPFANWGTRNLGRFAKPVFKFLGLPDQAFYDLTTDGCQAFNAKVPDVPSVPLFLGRGPMFAGMARARMADSARNSPPGRGRRTTALCPYPPPPGENRPTFGPATTSA